MKFTERIRREVLIIDGSMGLFLQLAGLPDGYAPDLWNLEKPDLIADVHKKYVEAGAQIVITNSFGATRTRLADYGRHSDVKAINHSAVQNARKGAGGMALVAGGIGPCGKMVAPLGEFLFTEAVEVFKEQASALLEAGVDLLIIETMFDLMELKAAVVACNELRGATPLIACMTYASGAVTDTGTTPEACAGVMEGLGVDVIGINCSTGPEEMLEVMQKLGRATSLPICVEPNAGMPVIVNGKTVYREPADVLAGYAEKFVELGANIIGGCCGTKPDYIEKISHSVKGKAPVTRSGAGGVVIASRSKIVRIGDGHPFAKIGEKINPTGKKKLASSLKDGRTDLAIISARKQTDAGADALDVNVGVPMTDEVSMMAKTLVALQNVTDLPLVIDSSDSEAILAGLNVYVGRPLLNSVNAEPEKLEALLPKAKKAGSAVIALCAGEDVPESAKKRFEYAKRIYKRAMELGFRKEDLVFDCLAVVVSAMQEGARQTLLTIRMIKEELDCSTIVGLSNSSFGLPDRPTINNAFLAMAMAEGLDAAIVNPYDTAMHKTAAGASLFIRRDEDCRAYIDMAEKQSAVKADLPAGKKVTAELVRDIGWKIHNAVLEGEKDSAKRLVQEALDEGLDPMDIFMERLTPAIRKVGELFAEKKKFIPHLVASADTMKRAMEILGPILKASRSIQSKGTIIFATVKGDVHDIGKNVCCIMLENFGFNVIDLGKNISAEEILQAAEKHDANIVALSALMTTTMRQMPIVINEIKKRKLPYMVMVGGAAVTRGFASEIGADVYVKDVGGIAASAENLVKTE